MQELSRNMKLKNILPVKTHMLIVENRYLLKEKQNSA